MSESARRGLPERVRMRHDSHFVEELAARHRESVGVMLQMSSIEPDPEQPRSAMGDLGDLAASIEEKGVLEPILVRPRPGAEPTEDLYRIVSGERRFRAALEAGLIEIPAIVMTISEEEALEIALIENLQRKDLTPFEEAEGYRALGERFAYTHEQISKAVGKSRTVVTESLNLLKMPARAREAAQALGVSSKSVLLGVLKSGEDEQGMVALLEQVAEQGLNRDDLRDRARKKRPAAPKRRRAPHTFKFNPKGRSYSIAVKFRKSTVEREELIEALEETLEELRREQADHGQPGS